MDKSDVPYWQRTRLVASLLARSAMDRRTIAEALRSAVWEVDSEVPVPEMKTMPQVMAESVAQRRFQMTLVILVAASALALAGLGTYGVASYSAPRRRAEMGIRMTLGADAVTLRWMILRQGLLPVSWGLALGGIASLAVGQILQGLLFQVSARDPITMVAVALVLFAVAVGACFIPARRATWVDPAITLRFEWARLYQKMPFFQNLHHQVVGIWVPYKLVRHGSGFTFVRSTIFRKPQKCSLPNSSGHLSSQ